MNAVPISTVASSMQFRKRGEQHERQRKHREYRNHGRISIIWMYKHPKESITKKLKVRFFWDEEIRNLMEDFKIPKDVINKVIRTTETECENQTSRQKYESCLEKVLDIDRLKN